MADQEPAAALLPLVAQLRDLLEKSNMSQKKLCEITNLQEGTLSNILSGKRPDPKLSSIMELAAGLDCELVLRKKKRKKEKR